MLTDLIWLISRGCEFTGLTAGSSTVYRPEAAFDSFPPEHRNQPGFSNGLSSATVNQRIQTVVPASVVLRCGIFDLAMVRIAKTHWTKENQSYLVDAT